MPISDDVVNIVVQALRKGMTRAQIAEFCSVSERAVSRISSSLRKYGTPRPPPKGLKMGRPNKLTRAQAEAVVVWAREHDHVFYIRDLHGYMRDNHEFKGGFATIRRALLRAGYKRKLPWRKSEVTTWIPPDGEPVFSFADDKKQAGSAMEEDQADDDNDHDETADEDPEEDVVDPAIRDSTSSGNQIRANEDSVWQQQHERQAPEVAARRIALPPNPYLKNSSNLRTHLTPRKQQQKPAKKGRGRPRKVNDIAASKPPASSGVAPSEFKSSNATSGQVEISALQSQIAEQQALIQALQQQLAQQTQN